MMPPPSPSLARRAALEPDRVDADPVLELLACVRSLVARSRHVHPRLRDGGARARLGRLGDHGARALVELERMLGAGRATEPVAAPRGPHRSEIEVVGVGTDLRLLLELDVLAARLQARIEKIVARGAPPRLHDTLGTLSVVVREIRAEYELYAA